MGGLDHQTSRGLAGSSNKYQNWETVDPEKWVPDGYVCIRWTHAGRDARRATWTSSARRKPRTTSSASSGRTQPWSNGKVGLLGISYYAMNQWQVAALHRPHLTAICPWEGGNDYYREFAATGESSTSSRPAGIRSRSAPCNTVSANGAHAAGIRANRWRGPTPCPRATGRLRAGAVAELLAHPLDDDYHRERTAEPEKITVPVLSAANWAHHLHTRGNFEGYQRVSSEQKWLEVHGEEHFTEFYTDYGVALQKRFFGHFLKGEDTGWDLQPPVQLNVRDVDGTYRQRAEQVAAGSHPMVHPVPRRHRPVTARRPTGTLGQAAFAATGDGLTFVTEPFGESVEITGPAAAKLYISSTTSDPTFSSRCAYSIPTARTSRSSAPRPGRGDRLRMAARLAPRHRPRTQPADRPWHRHDRTQPLVPGETVELDVEIWPTSVVVPAGFRVALTVLDATSNARRWPWPSLYGEEMKGNGIFLHTDPQDRPAEIYTGTTTLVSDPVRPSYVLLPFIGPDHARPNTTWIGQGGENNRQIR